jgi:hypothetical protein
MHFLHFFSPASMLSRRLSPADSENSSYQTGHSILVEQPDIHVRPGLQLNVHAQGMAEVRIEVFAQRSHHVASNVL